MSKDNRIFWRGGRLRTLNRDDSTTDLGNNVQTSAIPWTEPTEQGYGWYGIKPVFIRDSTTYTLEPHSGGIRVVMIASDLIEYNSDTTNTTDNTAKVDKKPEFVWDSVHTSPVVPLAIAILSVLIVSAAIV